VSESNWAGLIAELRPKILVFDPGLTDAEVERAEDAYEISFPVDLRDFLQTALPRGLGFPNWRSLDDRTIKEILSWPLEGILFDVERNDFWLPEWGPKPSTTQEVRAVVEEQVKGAPRLIPIYAHRMMPDKPREAGNPVLSVYQTDIIYYGFDLDDYFRHEFNLEGRKEWPAKVQAIEFWNVDRWQDLRWR
jgi:hypothetical protein